MSNHFNQLPAGSDQGKINEQPKPKKPQPPVKVDSIEPPKSPLKKKEK